MKESYYLIEKFSSDNHQAMLKEQLGLLADSVGSASADLESTIDPFVKLLVGLEEYELLITSLIELAQETTVISNKRLLLNTALTYAKPFASWATSGGEGIARMSTVNEIKKLLESLDK